MVDDKELRANGNSFAAGWQASPQSIVVRQVVGEEEQQKVMDIHVVVPDRKPPIEQIVDVFVKNVQVNSIDVITDKVIVRGEFEIKAIYVACLPTQPVHAVEIKHYKWTQDVQLAGARKGMDAEANVIVEFVDYDVAEMTRAYKYKHYDHFNDDSDDCEPPCEPPCPPSPMPVFTMPTPPCDGPPPCAMPMPQPICEPPPMVCPKTEDSSTAAEEGEGEECGTREFDVAVVLKVTAKVMTDRQVQVSPGGSMPTAPKG